ncbi:LysR family transcriptional regulator [Verticiella sediminum]|uniref:LysR family transcriptional regulator n=1 Tax=Verticiella sediminum TaxID=1247510 RepID=A0A556B1E8_9BURK|nr:LysR family transcriptional regulator [Verticiella sediminum]TSH98999.1 LysR family transcriptional regulator [Verticiella sediminum]
MELRQLRYLLEVVAAGSISRAAERLHIAQSAVSRQIADLEDELGTPLLQRRRGGVQPTEQGLRFVETAGAILRDVAALKQQMSAATAEPLTVRLGLPPTVSPMFLETVTRHLPAAPIPMRASIVEASSYWLQQRLYAGDLDCAVLTNPSPTRVLHIEPLWTETLCVIGSADSPLRGMATCTVAQIADLPLTQTPLPDNSRQAIEAAFEAAGLSLNVRQEHEALQFLKAQVLEGEHSILPRTVARSLAAARQYVAVPLPEVTIQRAFAARRGAIPSDAIVCLAGALRECARTGFAGDPWIRVA